MKKKGNDLSVGIRAVKASRSELFLIEKGLPAGFSRAGRLAKTNTGSICWSSTEGSDRPYYAWYVYFYGGDTGYYDKAYTYVVRAVLAFSIKTLR